MNPVDNPATQPGKNGGTLKRGGTNPGAGRPPNAFREECRRVSQETLPVLERIVKGTAQRGDSKPSFSDSRAAWSDIAKMGYGEAKVVIPDEIIPIIGIILGEEPEISMECIERITERLIERLKAL